ncbi:hypothetical protein OAA91_01375 [Fibrobacterales bacterium]|nr:hypothetical protein [Fibrobacterales bacterium]
MNKDEQEDRQEILEDLRRYEYINSDGYLILEPFGVYLSHCFGFDGILEISPQPKDVYDLLIQRINEKFSAEDVSRYVKIIGFNENTTVDLWIYQDKRMTLIHISALIQVTHDWIHDIGHILMEIPRPGDSPKYFYWAKEEWTAVFQFINGYHNFFSEYQKKIDLGGIEKSGFSAFEALYLSIDQDIDYAQAIKILKSRHEAYQAALKQIRRANESEFYLEAITLIENLISNCIYNYLRGNDKKPNNSTFHILIQEVLTLNKGVDDDVKELFKDVDIWRKGRNKSVHGFVKTKSDGLTQSYTEFLQLSKKTAKEGESFCKRVVSWYEKECINFFKHEFS